MAKNTAPKTAPDTPETTEENAPEAFKTVIEGDRITKAISVSFNADAKKAGRSQDLIVTLDFSNLSREALIERYAVKSAVIDLQRALRTAPDEDTFTSFVGASSDAPYEVLAEEAGHSPWASERKTADPMTRAKSALAKMTDEQKAELRALLEG